MQKRLIWLVEDEASIADTLIYALQTDGFEVEWFPLVSRCWRDWNRRDRIFDPGCGAAGYQRF